ncbi:MAG: Gfo/Idh/MocA family oxidoreductase [Victivallales bacterium]|nr:Gfo/Idh/MocA family oxidoreductase [Victivallales bacterium]
MQLVKDIHNLRLGIIGMTEGNGHPYSWSAMFNRYDVEAMTEECPFPVIPGYLNKEKWDSIGIPGAKVAMVYCDNRADAEHVARLSLIPAVAARPEEMIGQVDAVIVATDIGSQHVLRARPFIEAGVPLFIDKPLCDNREDLEWFKKQVANGARLCSSSSMKYCKELQPYLRGNWHEIGELRFMTLAMAKRWETYGIHALETVFALTGPGFTTIRNTGSEKRNIVHLTHRNGFDVVIGNIYDVNSGGLVTLCGTQGTLTIRIQDSYTAFRTQLVKFVEYLRTGNPPHPFSDTIELMQLVIGGIESRKNGGQVVKITT